MRYQGPVSVPRRAVWLVLLCGLVLQGFFAPATGHGLAHPSDVICAAGAPGADSDDPENEIRHDLCCTVACSVCCVVFVASIAGLLVLPLRRPTRVGLADDQIAAAGAPLDLYFAARGPPRL
jgi:hypothetical protein